MPQVSERSTAMPRVPWKIIPQILKHPLFWIMLVGFCVRLYGVAQFPFVHDEIHSILEGVNKTRVSPVHFLFRASLKHTLQITPLYFWVERLFSDILGQNQWGLRFFPLLSGVITPLLAYHVVRKRYDRNVATLSAFIVAFSDNFLWTTTKAQFFEVLLVPFYLGVFYFATSGHKNRYYYVSLFFSLAFLSSFGRSVFALLCFLAWYGLTKVFEWSRLGKKFGELPRPVGKELLQLSTFLWLVVLWIVGAQLFAFYNPIQTTVGGGELRSIWDALYRFSFGYGTATKQTWVGSVRGAFLVFDDTAVWPVTTLLFVPFVWGMVILAKDVIRQWKGKDESQFKRDSFLVVIALLSLFVLLAKGVIGARFHLFYFLSFAVTCSIALCSLVQYFKDDKRKWLLVVFVFLWGTHAAYASSWKNWTYFVWDEQLFLRDFLFSLLITGVFAVAAFLGGGVRVRFGRHLIRVSLAILLVFLLAKGPLVWGTELYSEPNYVDRLFDVEGDEDTVIDFAVERNRPEICNHLPEEYKEKCVSLAVQR